MKVSSQSLDFIDKVLSNFPVTLKEEKKIPESETHEQHTNEKKYSLNYNKFDSPSEETDP
jgi:hypothetical protein